MVWRRDINLASAPLSWPLCWGVCVGVCVGGVSGVLYSPMVTDVQVAPLIIRFGFINTERAFHLISNSTGSGGDSDRSSLLSKRRVKSNGI